MAPFCLQKCYSPVPDSIRVLRVHPTPRSSCLRQEVSGEGARQPQRDDSRRSYDAVF